MPFPACSFLFKTDKNGAETDRAKNIHLKSHNAENCKGDSLGLSKIQFVSKYQKLEGGPFGEIRKFSEKRLTKPKKIERVTFQSRPVLQMHGKVSR